MAEAVLRAQAAERSRIARAVHDDTVQVMTAVLLLLDRAAHNVRRYEDAEFDELLENIQQTLRQATERTRRLAFELWPTVLHERGLCPAITVIVEQTGREMGAQVSVSAPPARLQWSVEQLVFRTVQEAVANIRKHSDASSIVVNVALVGDVLVGVVHDDGRGFDLSEQPARDSAIPRMELAAMVEQVEASGGTAGSPPRPGKEPWSRFRCRSNQTGAARHHDGFQAGVGTECAHEARHLVPHGGDADSEGLRNLARRPAVR